MVRLKPFGIFVAIGIGYCTWKIFGSTFEYKFLSTFIGGILCGALVFGNYD